jgi:hypothetical protein
MKYVKLFENWLNESDSVAYGEEQFQIWQKIDDANSQFLAIDMIMHLLGKEYKGTGPWINDSKLPNLTVEFIGTDSNFKKGWKKSMTIHELFYNLCRPEWKSVELVYTGNLVTDLQTGGTYVVLKSSTNSAITTIVLPSTLQSGTGRMNKIAEDWSSRNSGQFEKLIKSFHDYLYSRGSWGGEEESKKRRRRRKGSSSGEGGGSGSNNSTITAITGGLY